MNYTVRERFDEINGQINRVGSDAVNYVFCADIHADEYLRKNSNGELKVFEDAAAVENRIEKTISHLKAAVNFAENNDNIDFLAIGGDIINSYSIKGKQAVIDTINRTLSPLRNCTKPVIIAFGNHDDNGFQILNPDVPEIRLEWLISDKDWKEKVLGNYPFAKNCVHDKSYEFSKYFYYDLNRKKTRVIVLDTMDMRKPFDENGTVTENVNRLPRFWYTNEQLDWLCGQALCAPEDWDYIIISHMGIENDTSCNCKNGENLRKIFKAFKERGAISFDYTDLNGGKICVNRDFGNIKSGKILLYNFGHQHAELVHYSKDIDLWQVATGCENAWGGCGEPGEDKNLPWMLMTDRTEGTERETCIDVFSVNRSIAYKFNVGPGKDAIMTAENI